MTKRGNRDIDITNHSPTLYKNHIISSLPISRAAAAKGLCYTRVFLRVIRNDKKTLSNSTSMFSDLNLFFSICTLVFCSSLYCS